MAIGKTKENFSHENLKIKIGSNIVIKNGELAEEMKGIPSAMDMKMLRKMITG